MTQLIIYPLPLLKLKSLKGTFSNLVDAVDPLANLTESAWTCASIWYIGGTGKHVLVDAGSSAEIMIKRGLSAETIQTPYDALKKVGVNPDEIDLVICTHLHNDHMQFGHLYSKAKFIIQRRELEANFSPHPLEASRCVPESSISGLDFIEIDGDEQVMNGISVLLTPGHTRGGQSVVIDTKKGKVIISGLCTIKDNFGPPEAIRKNLAVIPPRIHLNACEAYDSLIKIKQQADIVIPLHEEEFALGRPVPDEL